MNKFLALPFRIHTNIVGFVFAVALLALHFFVFHVWYWWFFVAAVAFTISTAIWYAFDRPKQLRK